MPRLYAQYRPDDASLDWLVSLQQHSAPINPQARAVPAKQLHLTIIHFGIINEVFTQLQAVAPKLVMTDYRQAVGTFVLAIEQAMAPTVLVQPNQLALFGFTRQTLVLTIDPTAELVKTHEQSLTALQQLFVGCGLTNPDDFMLHNQNFQFARTLQPHITLLKQAPIVPDVQPEPKKLQLQAMPILYD